MTKQSEKIDFFIFGYTVVLFGINLFWMIMFIIAWLSPSKRLTIDINVFGEANFELIIYIVFFICSIIWLFAVVHRTIGINYYDKEWILTIAIVIILGIPILLLPTILYNLMFS